MTIKSRSDGDFPPDLPRSEGSSTELVVEAGRTAQVLIL